MRIVSPRIYFVFKHLGDVLENLLDIGLLSYPQATTHYQAFVDSIQRHVPVWEEDSECLHHGSFLIDVSSLSL